MKNERKDIESGILGLSKEELLTALKNRKGYEPEATEVIIREAIRRGLIDSEDDLLSPEFNPVPARFTFFPCPGSEMARNRIIKSLMRSLMIPGIIPVYFGIMKFGIPKYIEGAALVSLGAIWITMALFIMLRYERKLIYPMTLLLILSMIYAGRILLAHQYPTWTDIFIPVVLYLFAIYSLIYAFILLTVKKQEKKEI
jgi:hypothetical protein